MVAPTRTIVIEFETVIQATVHLDQRIQTLGDAVAALTPAFCGSDPVLSSIRLVQEGNAFILTFNTRSRWLYVETKESFRRGDALGKALIDFMRARGGDFVSNSLRVYYDEEV